MFHATHSIYSQKVSLHVQTHSRATVRIWNVRPSVWKLTIHVHIYPVDAPPTVFVHFERIGGINCGKEKPPVLITIFILLDTTTRRAMVRLARFSGVARFYGVGATRPLSPPPPLPLHRPRKIESSLTGLIFQLQWNSQPISSCTVFGNRWLEACKRTDPETNRGNNRARQ